MNKHSNNAPARQFKRHATRFEARIEPMPEHSDQLRLSYPDALSGLAVIDVSEGGLGVQCGIYLPKNLRMKVHVHSVEEAGEQLMANLTVLAVVRRCVLEDHKPTYQVGMQFIDPNGADERRLIRAVVDDTKQTVAVAAMGESSVS